jgi:hypothetical protein
MLKTVKHFLLIFSALYGVLFPGQESAAAFSNYRVWEAVGFIFSYILQTQVHTYMGCGPWGQFFERGPGANSSLGANYGPRYAAPIGAYAPTEPIPMLASREFFL